MGRRAAEHILGAISGFAIAARVLCDDRLEFEIGLHGQRYYSRGESYPLTDAIEPLGLVRRLDELLKQVPQAAVAAKAELVKIEADLPRLKRQMAPTPFVKQDRLVEARQRLAELGKLARVVSEYARIPVGVQRPMVGAYAFRHTARLHQVALEGDASAYAWINPAILGRAHSKVAAMPAGEVED